MKKEGRGIIAEMIVPLPKETPESFYKGINFLMDSKVDNIINYTLQINYGTQYSDLTYAKKFGYVSRYRPYVNCFGKYAGDIVMEVEQVGVATNSLTKAKLPRDPSVFPDDPNSVQQPSYAGSVLVAG